MNGWLVGLTPGQDTNEHGDRSIARAHGGDTALPQVIIFKSD